MTGWNKDTALRAAVWFAAFSILWIVVTDRIVDVLASTAEEASRLQTLKGVAFLLVASGFVYLLVRRETSARSEAEAGRLGALERHQALLERTVAALARTIEQRDRYSADHQQRNSELLVAIARRLALPPEQIDHFRLGALVHDIGMLSVPAEILTRPGPLSPQEFALVRLHSKTGYDIIRDVGLLDDVALGLLQHHERLDGSGYPDGLKGDAICLCGRIAAVADVVEAMVAHRPWRPALGLDAAVAEIVRGKGTKYDPAAVDACLAVLGDDGLAERLQRQYG